MRTFVALTPLAGALSFPVIVPLILIKVGLPAAVLASVLIGSSWMVTMLRTAEMPGHG
ncbi:MAG: hypothetical protein ACKOCM_06885 [Cyanobacteriota bacterium]